MSAAKGTYAAKTDVPVDRSRSELERVLTRWGASQFAYGQDQERWVVGFAFGSRAVRIVMIIPSTPQEQRQRWRALVLVVKAKLEAISLGLVDFETEFLGHLVLPTGETMAEHVGPQLPAMYERGAVPSIMPALGAG
jgi:hypothetical protein